MVHRSGTGKVSETAWRTDYLKPSQSPSDVPSLTPSQSPSLKPSQSPSDVPSLTPSQSPSACPIPTTVTGTSMTYIGDGFCRDTNKNSFDYVQVPGEITTVDACYAKCNSIGAWTNHGTGLVFSCALDTCLCNFENGYLPTGYDVYADYPATTGAVVNSGGSYNGKCFA